MVFAIDELGPFCCRMLDDAFGNFNPNLYLPGDNELDQSPREKLRIFLDKEMKARQKGQKQAKFLFARNLRALVLLVLEHDGANFSEYGAPGSIPPELYRKVRHGIAKVLPTFWETVVLNMFGDEKVSTEVDTGSFVIFSYTV